MATISANGFQYSLERLQARRVTRVHEHTSARICVILRGDVAEERSRREEFGVGHLLYRPADIRHRNAYGNAAPLVLRIDVAPHRLELPSTRALREPVSIRPARIATVAARARAELADGDQSSPLILEGIGLELLAELARSARHSDRSTPRWVERTAERLREDFARGASLAELAAGAGVHPAHLTQCFRDRYGCSIGEYLRRTRIAFACRELRETGRPLAEIALAAGFCDQSHFANSFKREVGRTPSQYRRLPADPAEGRAATPPSP